MSATTALMLTGACWLVLGLALAILLGRRGHDPFTWLVLGAVLGPLSVSLAAFQAHTARPRRRQVATGRAGAGPVDVLVGIDGSRAAADGLGAVLDLLGPRLGRLTLAGVAELDETAAERAHERALAEELERQAAMVRAWQRAQGNARWAGRPELVLVTGNPASALRRLALQDGYDLLVVGAHGAGRATTLLGDVAARLAADAEVPVLIVPRPAGVPGPNRTTRTFAATSRGDRLLSPAAVGEMIPVSERRSRCD